MSSFLAAVAQDLLSRFGTDMTNVTVVFPNKRARLFLNEELLARTSSPMWAPRYASIAELFDIIVGDEVMETVPAVCRLYHIYKEAMGEKAESLDMFWGWGEILLQDFEDIDKHLVDADALFLNAKELNEMESLDFLTDNQRDALERFFGSFDPGKRTHIQERFKELWTVMPRLYHGLRENLPEGAMPYRGALERKAVENIGRLTGQDAERTYCFVGFNMLSETEKKLMSHLEGRGRAVFYWDYDVMYLENTEFEAGDFIRENLLRFPNALKGCDIYDNLRKKTDITFISTSTDSIATRYIPEWLGRKHLTETERETALVLCDEQQLQTVLHAIPDGEKQDEEKTEFVKETNFTNKPDEPNKPNNANDTKCAESQIKVPRDVNITMGYTLTGTPVFSLVLALIALQTDGWDEKRRRFRMSFLKAVNLHPYSAHLEQSVWNRRVEPTDAPALVEYLDEIVIALATKFKEDDSDEPQAEQYDVSVASAEDARTKADKDFDDVLMLESIYLIHKTLLQFLGVVADAEYPLHLQPTTLRRLLRRVLGTRSIPFHGEPAQGLQVMGVLETRCLDFRHLLMLNVGEGFLPRNSMDNSLIPFTLRVGFGLTTVRHRIAVFAYYFYRLIQRAEHVTCIYNENSSGTVRHEMSRFLRQLQAETDLPIHYLRLEASQDVMLAELDEIPKSPDILALLHERHNLKVNAQARPISPSSINRYLDCKMKFYLSTVCGMRVEQDPDDGIDARLMGNIFHNSAEEIYREMLSHSKDNTIPSTQISAYTKDKGDRLQRIIDEQFKKEANVTEFRGENILIREVIERYLLNLLRWDEAHAPITMEAMESDVSMPIDVKIENETVTVLTGGRVDRMDILTEADGTRHFRILDYKTGSHENDVRKFADIFKPDHTHAGYYLQTFLYALAAKHEGTTTLPIKPVLFYTAKAGRPDYDPTLHIASGESKKDADSTVPSGPVENIALYEKDFLDGLSAVIAEIFSPKVPFSKTSNADACKYCDFRKLCNR